MPRSILHIRAVNCAFGTHAPLKFKSTNDSKGGHVMQVVMELLFLVQDTTLQDYAIGRMDEFVIV